METVIDEFGVVAEDGTTHRIYEYQEFVEAAAGGQSGACGPGRHRFSTLDGREVRMIGQDEYQIAGRDGWLRAWRA